MGHNSAKATISVNGGPEYDMDSPEAKKEIEKVVKRAVGKAKAHSEDAKDVGGVAGARLRAFIERVERLEEEKKGLGDDIKDIWSEAKGVGYDVKTMKKILRLRKMDPQKMREEQELENLYKAAIGMQTEMFD